MPTKEVLVRTWIDSIDTDGITERMTWCDADHFSYMAWDKEGDCIPVDIYIKIPKSIKNCFDVKLLSDFSEVIVKAIIDKE